MATNTRSIFFIGSFSMAHLIEFRLEIRADGSINKCVNCTHWRVTRKRKILTVDPNMLPPNQTAYRCMWCEITLTSIGFGYNRNNNKKSRIFVYFVLMNHRRYAKLTIIRPQLRFSLIFSRASTARLMSRCNRLPKSLNIVDPPLNTILLYNGRRTSIGQFWMTLSTTSLIDAVKSGLENSGWKNISGPASETIWVFKKNKLTTIGIVSTKCHSTHPWIVHSPHLPKTVVW